MGLSLDKSPGRNTIFLKVSFNEMTQCHIKHFEMNNSIIQTCHIYIYKCRLKQLFLLRGNKVHGGFKMNVN